MNLGLGTAQFGLDYGVSNKRGKIPFDEVIEILEYASAAGVRFLDTAPSYGDSEVVLGRAFSQIGCAFNVITKTKPTNRALLTREDAESLIRFFHESLIRLAQPSVYGLLVHHAADLTAQGGDLIYKALLELKAGKLVKKIGVSVYTAAEIDIVCGRYDIDLIQLPLNVFDQRLISSGHLARLKSRGIEIHARSVFLQGLLLMPADEMDDYFQPARENVRRYQTAMRERRLPLLAAALAFIEQRPEIDCALAGVSSLENLCEIISQMNSLPAEKIDFGHFAMNSENFLNPFLWQLKGRPVSAGTHAGENV